MWNDPFQPLQISFKVECVQATSSITWICNTNTHNIYTYTYIYTLHTYIIYNTCTHILTYSDTHSVDIRIPILYMYTDIYTIHHTHHIHKHTPQIPHTCTHICTQTHTHTHIALDLTWYFLSQNSKLPHPFLTTGCLLSSLIAHSAAFHLCSAFTLGKEGGREGGGGGGVGGGGGGGGGGRGGGGGEGLLVKTCVSGRVIQKLVNKV